MDPSSPKIIAANRKKQQNNKNSAGFKVKKQAHAEQINSTQLIRLIDKRIKKQHECKKGPEKQLRKKQRLIL